MDIDSAMHRHMENEPRRNTVAESQGRTQSQHEHEQGGAHHQDRAHTSASVNNRRGGGQPTSQSHSDAAARGICNSGCTSARDHRHDQGNRHTTSHHYERIRFHAEHTRGREDAGRNHDKVTRQHVDAGRKTSH